MSKKSPILILPDLQVKELEKQDKQERDRRIAERIHCIILTAQGYAWQELKRILLGGVRPFKKWVGVYLGQGIGGLGQWGYQGQAGNLNDEQGAEVEAELEGKLYRSAKEGSGLSKTGLA